MCDDQEISEGANIDFGRDWSYWLSDGETILSSSWTITNGATLGSNTVVGAITYTFVSGAVLGKMYDLVNTITTSQGRVDKRSMKIYCKTLCK